MSMAMSWSRLQVLRRFLRQDACATASVSTCQVRHERLRRQAVPLRPRKEAKEWDGPTARSNQFADWQRSRVSGGDGGAGCISLLSAHRKEFAGPDGGDGGNGGHVVFKVGWDFTHWHKFDVFGGISFLHLASFDMCTFCYA